MRAAYPLPPPARAGFARVVGAGGTPLVLGTHHAGGSRAAVFGGPPLCPCCAPGGPRLCLGSFRFLRGERTPWVFVPLFCLYWSCAGHRGLMAILCGDGPRSGLTSLRRIRRHVVILAVRVHAVFGPGAVCAVEVLWPGALAAVSIVALGAAVCSPRDAPLPPSAPCFLFAWAVGGFSSTPPRPRPSSP